MQVCQNNNDINKKGENTNACKIRIKITITNIRKVRRPMANARITMTNAGACDCVRPHTH